MQVYHKKNVMYITNIKQLKIQKFINWIQKFNLSEKCTPLLHSAAKECKSTTTHGLVTTTPLHYSLTRAFWNFHLLKGPKALIGVCHQSQLSLAPSRFPLLHWSISTPRSYFCVLCSSEPKRNRGLPVHKTIFLNVKIQHKKNSH